MFPYHLREYGNAINKGNVGGFKSCFTYLFDCWFKADLKLWNYPVKLFSCKSRLFFRMISFMIWLLQNQNYNGLSPILICYMIKSDTSQRHNQPLCMLVNPHEPKHCAPGAVRVELRPLEEHFATIANTRNCGVGFRKFRWCFKSPPVRELDEFTFKRATNSGASVWKHNRVVSAHFLLPAVCERLTLAFHTHVFEKGSKALQLC